MNVVCTNEACTENGIPKGNPMDYAPEDIVCGGCGGPVEPTSEPPPEPPAEPAA